MKQRIDTPMTFEDYNLGNSVGNPAGNSLAANALLPMDDAEELDWLMSLALDDALDADEAARLETLLCESPDNAERWGTWQAMDSVFHEVPSALPAADFGDKFALRLELKERQRRLRTGAIFVIAAVAMWGSAFVGLGMLGALLWSNQAVWMSGIVHNLAYWWAAVGQFGQVLLNTVDSLWAAPQTRAALVCYVVASMMILVGWFVFLRRSTRELPMGEVQFVEA